MSVIVANGGLLGDLVYLGVHAGRCDEDFANTPERKEEFRKQLKKVMDTYDVRCEKYAGLQRGTCSPEVQKVLSGKDFYCEEARYAAADIARQALLKVPKKMTCICPEMKVHGEFSESVGGETSGGWKRRREQLRREPESDVPVGGCMCVVHIDQDPDIAMVVDLLVMAPES
jgi:hypothetical protein